MLLALACALFWNLLTAPVCSTLFGEIFTKGNRLALLALAFPAVGLGLIYWAIVAVLRWRKYGRSVFEMDSVPGVIGGKLAGVIRALAEIQPENVCRIKLSCIKCVASRGSDHTITRSILWEDEQLIAHELSKKGSTQMAIPVLFQIPYECHPTDETDSNNMTLWSLEVTAHTPGLQYRAEFDVPVFKTPQSDPNFVLDRSPVAKYVAPENPEQDVRDAGVVKTESPAGDGCRLVFPMARLPVSASLLTLNSLAFLGSPFLLLHLESPLPYFGLLFGLFGLISLWMTADMWFYRSAIDVSRHGLTVTGGLFGRGTSRLLVPAEVAKIQAVSGSQAMSGWLYDVVIICRDGRRVKVGKRLPDKRLATAVIQQIEQAIGGNSSH